LIVHKGVIHQIGPDLPVPAGAQVIDASAMQISPGLIDCHSHMASDSGINEATQAITAEVRIADFIDASDITIYRQLAGGLTSANILHGSANPIGGQNQVIKLRWGATYDELKFQGAPQGIKFALGENVKQSNVEGSTRSRYPQSRMGVEQIFRDRFNAALTYSQQWESWGKERKGLPPRRDLELEAIAEILKGERWVHCHSFSIFWKATKLPMPWQNMVRQLLPSLTGGTTNSKCWIPFPTMVRSCTNKGLWFLSILTTLS
jgi:N-acetylglucosamine-6-phosphate deacetylase